MRKGLKEIMKAIINREVKKQLATALNTIASEHDVRIHMTRDDVKLTYSNSIGCWEYKTAAYVIVDDSHNSLIIDGLLHDTGDVSMVTVSDRYSGDRVWALFDSKGDTDAGRQIEYDAIA